MKTEAFIIALARPDGTAPLLSKMLDERLFLLESDARVCAYSATARMIFGACPCGPARVWRVHVDVIEEVPM